jgi:hypothetical protein
MQPLRQDVRLEHGSTIITVRLRHHIIRVCRQGTIIITIITLLRQTAGDLSHGSTTIAVHRLLRFVITTITIINGKVVF